MTATETIAQTVTVDAIASPFLKALVQQIRAHDAYGTYRQWSDELLLKPFIVTRQQKREISVEGEVDTVTQKLILAFYRAIAAQIERETGKLAQVMVDLNHEGFGWALVLCGRLVAVTKPLRDAQRFGFDSLDKLAAEGDKLTQSGIDYVKRFPEVANI